MAKSVLPCPECKFPNLESASRCLACGVELGLVTHAVSALSPEDLETVAGLTPPPLNDTNKFSTSDPPGSPESGRQPMVTDEVVAWLSCEALPPIALGPLTKVTLGRSRDCDLILPHKTVSRVHGTVRVRGSTLLYEDSSSYGSLVNGRTAIGVVELEVGDTLTLGPYDVRIKPADLSRGVEHHEEKTQPLDLTPFRAQQGTVELMGSLAHGMLVEVLQGLEFNGKTGTLRVRSEHGEGALTVRRGSPHSAKLGSLEGEEAIFAMLGLKSGTFAFSGGPPDPVERPLTRPLTTILFEASRRIDEDRGQV
ncbi:MAG: DUF4388 domain-containing protein [Planctomycetota bacterium]